MEESLSPGSVFLQGLEASNEGSSSGISEDETKGELQKRDRVVNTNQLRKISDLFNVNDIIGKSFENGGKDIKLIDVCKECTSHITSSCIRP